MEISFAALMLGCVYGDEMNMEAIGSPAVSIIF